MRVFMFVAPAVVLALGTVGVMAMRERGRNLRSKAPSIDESAEVATISTGERVDIGAHVPRQGLTIVEFTADF
jgi:hypothetical protein